MVYGSQDLTTSILVERNVTMGSRHSAGILVGGGPVIVRNNIGISNDEDGITLEDYKKRGFLRSVNNVADAGTAFKAYPGPLAGLRMGAMSTAP